MTTGVPKWAESQNSDRKLDEKIDTQMVLSDHLSNNDSDNNEVANLENNEDLDFDEVHF